MLSALVLTLAVMQSSHVALYDVVWDSPSADASGSMPLGNGELVVNTWVEESTGDLLFYMGRTDSLSEISRILKLGRVRISFDPPILLEQDFRQRLHLTQGLVDIRTPKGNVSLFVDSRFDVVHVMGESRQPVSVTATLENWRTEERTLPKDEHQSAWSVHDAPFPLIESPDVFISPPGLEDAVVWYHRNETSVIPKLWENQSLLGLRGLHDPLIHRTFGGMMSSPYMVKKSERSLEMASGMGFQLKVTTHSKQVPTVDEWVEDLKNLSAGSERLEAFKDTATWWDQYFSRAWVFVSGDQVALKVPTNNDPLRKGQDSNGQNRFPGEIADWQFLNYPAKPGTDPSMREARETDDFQDGFTLMSRIKLAEAQPGRIFDKLTAGQEDGFLFDTHPGNDLRLIVGPMTLRAPKALTVGRWHDVRATYDGQTGEAAIYLDGKRIAHRPGESGSMVTKGYILQRYMQGIQSRGEYPVKFNGGYATVEPTAMGRPFNADWRNWGDCHWFQNVRHIYHPMLATDDYAMMEPFWRLYENSRLIAEERTRRYHKAEGAYFPETMTISGLYSGGDYGWDRTGLEPKDVQCPWWDDAWNQGPELVGLMLDRWDYTRDETFLQQRVVPMAMSVLRYFDTRFRKDREGRIILDPTQVVETYWEGVVNDMPTTAGLISITERLVKLPGLTPSQLRYFERMRKACPELPIEDGKLAPAQKYAPKISNVENGELYAAWPFRLVSVARPELMQQARSAYAARKNRLDTGWGYDGNVAANLGLADEAARILQIKVRNSNPAYRWPATWGPNFDWLPDQNHGGNLLNTTHLMLMQADSIEDGGKIYLLPAWPKDWDADFQLFAPARTAVRCVYRAGKLVTLKVVPESRRKDIVLPEGLTAPQ